MRKGFTLVELGISMGILGSLALVGAQEDQFEISQMNARALGNEIFQYNNATSRYLAAYSARPGDIGTGVSLGTDQVMTGSSWLKGPGCLGGSADEAYLACAMLPNGKTLQYHSQPKTTISMDADGALQARTVWSAAYSSSGVKDGTVMGVAAMVASGNYISQVEDGTAGYQGPTIYCPDLDTYNPTMSALCGIDKNTMVSTVSTNSGLDPWLRTDHGNTMRHVIEFGNSPVAQSDIDAVDDGGGVGGWVGSGMRQIINVARLYNSGGSGDDSLIIGRQQGKALYSDGFLTGRGLLEGAVITDGDAAVMGEFYAKASAFVQADIEAGNDIIAQRHLRSATGNVIADTGSVLADNGQVRGNYVRSLGDVRADRYVHSQRYYDSNNTSFYTDPASTSRMDSVDANRLESRGDVIGGRFVDRNNGTYRVDPSGYSRITDLRVDGYADIYGFTRARNGLRFANGGYSGVSVGKSCSVNGELKRSNSSGDILNCVSGKWTSLGSPSGVYAFFGSTTCPTGWVKANGYNGTVDMRGEFIRGWDNGKGVDSGRSIRSWQRHMIERHKHVGGYSETYSGPWGHTSKKGFQGSGDTDSDNRRYHTNDGSNYYGTVNPAGVIGHETRPRNRALLVCMKK